MKQQDVTEIESHGEMFQRRTEAMPVEARFAGLASRERGDVEA